MRTYTIEKTVYKFEELSQEAKDTAINNEINFTLEMFDYEQQSDGLKKAIDKAEAMQTPWFTGSYVYEYCLDEIIANIKLNDYEFDEAGNIA